MDFIVFGTGAVGGYYGGRLAEHGHTVHFLARSDYETIQREGLKVHSPNGDIHLTETSVFNNVHDIPRADVILVALKTTGNTNLKEQIAPLVHPGAALLILQNGLGMEEEFKSWFPDNPVLGGMCFIGCRKLAPGIIEHQDKGAISMACLDPADKTLLESVGSAFTESSVTVNYVESLGEARWRKLLWNIPYNGLSVSLNSDTGEIMSHEHSRRMVRDLMNEVLQGAAVCGYEIEETIVEKMMHYTSIMTPYEPSMKQDFMSGRAMELEYMYDRPIQAAADNGCELKKIVMLRDHLRFLEETKDGS